MIPLKSFDKKNLTSFKTPVCLGALVYGSSSKIIAG